MAVSRKLPQFKLTVINCQIITKSDNDVFGSLKPLLPSPVAGWLLVLMVIIFAMLLFSKATVELGREDGNKAS